jgi:uncharacterized protein (DUF1778 family)
MSINLAIDVDDQSTPVLAALTDQLTDRTGLHQALAIRVAEHTRQHIRRAATTRHKTAQRFGLQPTNYLAKKADTVEHSHDADGITLRVEGAIFRRVNGPVTIRPREKKYLTIPVNKEAVGRKASELWWPKSPSKRPRKGRRASLIQGLIFITSKKGNLLLAKPEDDGSITPYYVLKKQVTLPQDTGLLPTGQDLAAVAEQAAIWYLRFRERQEQARPA